MASLRAPSLLGRGSGAYLCEGNVARNATSTATSSLNFSWGFLEEDEGLGIESQGGTTVEMRSGGDCESSNVSLTCVKQKGQCPGVTRAARFVADLNGSW